MSWTSIMPCWHCKRKDECPDAKVLTETANQIHLLPEHAEKGGWGTIMAACVRMETTVTK